MQSFPSSIENDGRAAYNQHSNISKNNKEIRQTYTPKYSQMSLFQNHKDRFLNQEVSQKNANITNLHNNEKFEQIYSFKKRENDFHRQPTSNMNNKRYLRRPNSAMAYNNANGTRNRKEDEEASIYDFNIESFLNSIQIESESNEESKTKPKKIKKKSKTRPTSPRDNLNLFAQLPQQFEKPMPKKKENNKPTISTKPIDYNHLNGKELYSNPPNLEKFSTRLKKESRKDAVLQRAILAKYSQNQIEYIKLNKEKKKTVPPEQLIKTSLSNDSSQQTNESNSDNSSFKTSNDDSVEFKLNSAASTPPNSSRNQQQIEGTNDKNRKAISKNEDKFSHLNCRMTSLINYSDLTKVQSSYTKKIKKDNKYNIKTQKDDDTQKEQKNKNIPPRLFFSRTPLFDDPENPKQRETQRIIPNQQVSKSLPKEKDSSSRAYANTSNINKDINDINHNDFTPHLIPSKQTIGPTPQAKDTNLQTLPMLNSSHQRASTTISNKPPHLLLTTPHSKSNHNSARKYNENSLFGTDNKDNNAFSTKKINKPPIIPNSKYNSNKLKYKDNTEIDDINNANDSPKSSSSNINASEISHNSSRSNNSNDLTPIARSNIQNKRSNSQLINYPVKKGKNLNKIYDFSGSDVDDQSQKISKDDYLIPVPRKRHIRTRNSHQSLIIDDKDRFFSALAKIHNLSDSTSPPTPKSTNSLNRKQNNMGIFKLNPILPTKKPKEEKSEEPEETEKVEKAKPVDSITFQLTALEKFKKEKKRKQLEEKGIYHYKKETNANKKQTEKVEDEIDNKDENEIKDVKSSEEEENQNEIDDDENEIKDENDIKNENEIKDDKSPEDEEENQNETYDDENEMNPVDMNPIEKLSSVDQKLVSNDNSESPIINSAENDSENGLEFKMI